MIRCSSHADSWCVRALLYPYSSWQSLYVSASLPQFCSAFGPILVRFLSKRVSIPQDPSTDLIVVITYRQSQPVLLLSVQRLYDPFPRFGNIDNELFEASPLGHRACASLRLCKRGNSLSNVICTLHFVQLTELICISPLEF